MHMISGGLIRIIKPSPRQDAVFYADDAGLDVDTCLGFSVDGSTLLVSRRNLSFSLKPPSLYLPPRSSSKHRLFPPLASLSSALSPGSARSTLTTHLCASAEAQPHSPQTGAVLPASCSCALVTSSTSVCVAATCSSRQGKPTSAQTYYTKCGQDIGPPSHEPDHS